ncbi:filamentous hemagglutinin N-terminal domain-containing protein [Gloeocapsopsis crepidinum LEGE 06123]|uniref:Filamentous hemagglutinin N-terminal domain-containing protein n=1 Tax=Gloeocapsopsis crepidinum LEGE 06123 TaxID=588587 RepID=A0ABR9V0Z0_9CHRO|nr:filamentous hemagglutinin N-terminal domain-containing protein [Gloeocapsopsis crepidinum]MBE9193163.1 filamentous hemagglutinin N-terminal domain-containing protein [Gloeocapsopsis crepidinum LEGE 06123]
MRSAIGGDRTLAQVTADPSIGTTVTLNGDTFEITNGTTVGDKNLFHSFSNFSIPNGGTAHFVNAPAIVNVLARVTGGNPSDIQGLIRAEGNANLFLMNPNGILFGPNAQLDLGGSFVATTANAIQFPGGAEFAQNTPVSAGNSLLSVNPSAFLFNQITTQPIENNSIAPAGLDEAGNSGYFGLRVPDGQNLLLVGGDITADSGGIVAFGGRIDLAAVAGTGTVGLEYDGNNFSLSVPNNLARADVSLTNGAGFIVAGGGGGDIAISAQNINILEGSGLYAGILSNLGSDGAQAGDIILEARRLSISNGAQVSAITFGQGHAGNLTVNVTDAVELIGTSADGQFSSGLFARAEQGSEGNAGNITVKTRRLLVQDGAQVSTRSRGEGQAGNLTINASESVKLSGTLTGTGMRSRLIAVGFSDAKAAGDITINTGRLVIKGGAIAVASTFGEGQAGNLTVNAIDAVELSGISADGQYRSTLAAETSGTGKAGALSINTGKLIINDGAIVSASTFNAGQAGDLTVNATERVELSGISVNGQYRSALAAETYGTGKAGALSIDTGKLIINDGAIAANSTFGEGAAGKMILRANDSISLSRGYISSSVGGGAIGDGGNINIETRSLTLINGGQVAAAVFRAQGDVPGGQGKGGSIRINASNIIRVSGVDLEGFSSGLFTNTQRGASGQGGEIIVNTDIFHIGDGAVVNAQTSNPSNGGNITINASNLEATSGGQILTTTSSSGTAGSITLHIADNLTISGSDPTFTSRLAQFSQDVVSNQGSASGIFANTTSNSTGKGGGINIDTTTLDLTNGAQLSAQSQGTGSAGNITVNATGELSANNSEITTAATQSGGGDITIAASDIRLRNDSDIRTDLTSSAGSGGDINLTADSIIAFDDSDILASAPEGQGGNITLNTPVFFGFGYRPGNSETDYAILDGNNRVDVNATGAIASGNITTPDTTFVQNSLTELPANVIDTGTLVANSCIARSSDRQQGNFIITGNGGLPTRPGDITASSYPTGTVRSIPSDRAIDASRPWQIGDPIVEPQGAYRLPNGQLILSRECK